MKARTGKLEAGIFFCQIRTCTSSVQCFVSFEKWERCSWYFKYVIANNFKTNVTLHFGLITENYKSISCVITCNFLFFKRDGNRFFFWKKSTSDAAMLTETATTFISAPLPGIHCCQTLQNLSKY